MRRVFAPLALWLCLSGLVLAAGWAPLAKSTPRPVQGKENLSTLATTFTQPVGNGDAVLVWFYVSEATQPSTATVADNASGNTYTLIQGPIQSSGTWGTTLWVYTFAAYNVQNSPTTVTATVSGSPTGPVMVIEEYAGIASASAVDGTGALQWQSSPGTGSDTQTSGTYTTSQSGDLIWGVGNSGGASLPLGTGFTAGKINDVANSVKTEFLIQGTASASTAATFGMPVNTFAVTGSVALKAKVR